MRESYKRTEVVILLAVIALSSCGRNGISRYGDLLSSQQLIQTEYFAVIEPTAGTTKSLSRADQKKVLQALLIFLRANKSRWLYIDHLPRNTVRRLTITRGQASR